MVWRLYRLSPTLAYHIGAWGRREYLKAAQRAAST